MRTHVKTALVAALPLASLLWITSPAVAHDSHRHDGQRRSWSESYRHPHASHYRGWERHQGYNSSWGHGKNQQKYNKAMRRLDRQEREARAKAYRRYDGDRRDPHYRERLAEIDRKYDHKRHKVERNWGYRR
ncbi:MAG: hypothetical protein AB7G75_29450 [Candidatus Binatia bacterium]